jgi:hypothetical protein
MYNYGAAMVLTEKNDFNGAMKHAAEVKMDYFVFKYDTGVLKLKAYYELGDVKNGVDLARSSMQFLRQDKFFKKECKEYYRAFFKCCSRLFDPDKRRFKRDIEYYRAKLETEKRVACREWLLERLNETARPGMWKKQAAGISGSSVVVRPSL